MKLLDFQIRAINDLLKLMEDSCKDIVLKSPTGSGKTIILTHFMNEYLRGHSNSVFVWLTPGKGSLEEQSKKKMDLYIHNSQTKLLSEVMVSGFEENDCCFINWEKLTKKGNNALKDSEKNNFIKMVNDAILSGLNFFVVIDESHQNFTEKSDAIIQLFKTNKIIRCSATPIIDNKAKLIEISEDDVIAEGLIKKQLIINENFPQSIITNNQTEFLLEKAIEKQIELINCYHKYNKSINPLIVVQMPNNSDALFVVVQNYLKSKGISIENENLAVWLSDMHENLDGIIELNGPQKVVVIKQAIATGWDCPRAQILVKLRDNMDETFEIQTIGRIRRMPEAEHYGNDILDSCYLYTFDSKFTDGVKNALGQKALDSKTLFLKNEYKDFTLTKEQRTSVTDYRDPRKALTAICKYLYSKFSLTGNKKENQIRLESNGFIFSDDIVKHTISGKVVNLSELSDRDKLNVIDISEPINTTIHGREYHNRVGRIGLEIGLEYAFMNTILGKLFSSKFSYTDKILKLEPRQMYAFIINNFDLLRILVREAMAARLAQLTLEFKDVSLKEFRIPRSTLFTYRGETRIQQIYYKNVYQGYLSSAEPRSLSEKRFEKFCEKNECVDWFYKNGDKGDEYFSIVYYDNSNNQKLFYPDYIVSVNNLVWIIETKGGFTRSGGSQDIDIFSPKKFELLKRYVDSNKINGGFVRYDEATDELYIARENYNEDINSSDWELLSDIFKEVK